MSITVPMSRWHLPPPDYALEIHKRGITAYLLSGTHHAVYLTRLIGGDRPFWVWCNYWPERWRS